MQRSEWLSVGCLVKVSISPLKWEIYQGVCVQMEMVQWREHRGDAGKEASPAGRWLWGRGRDAGMQCAGPGVAFAGG